MLIISRKKNEKLIINNNIEITIVEVLGSKVRFGIKAPDEVVIQKRYQPVLETKDPAKPAPPEAEKLKIAASARSFKQS